MEERIVGYRRALAAGEQATELLLAQISGRVKTGCKLCLGTELVIRRSVAAPQDAK